MYIKVCGSQKRVTGYVVWNSVWLISYSEGFATKLYHQEIRNFGHLKRVLLHCWGPRLFVIVGWGWVLYLLFPSP